MTRNIDLFLRKSIEVKASKTSLSDQQKIRLENAVGSLKYKRVSHLAARIKISVYEIRYYLKHVIGDDVVQVRYDRAGEIVVPDLEKYNQKITAIREERKRLSLMNIRERHAYKPREVLSDWLSDNEILRRLTSDHPEHTNP